jgi:hypothetical protein
LIERIHIKGLNRGGVSGLAIDFDQHVGRLGPSKTKSMVINGDDTSTAGTNHSHIATRADAHLMQSANDVRFAVNFDNRRGRADSKQSQRNYMPQGEVV